MTELGAFLRDRRESVTPADVGLPTGPRRRTPGLRRAEVATLAGVSVDYLTRIEQGRDRRPSPQILGAIADALRFTAEDRSRLRMLIFREKEVALCPSVDHAPDRAVTAPVRAVLDRLDPAVALNRLGDLLAHTPGFARVAGPVGLLAAGNLVRYLFTDPAARATFPDWDTVADHTVAQLKGDTHRTDPHVVGFADELAITAGAAFTDRFAAPTQLPARFGTERWAHPEAGPLALSYETLLFPDSPDLRIVTYLPADEPTADALTALADRPALRTA